MRSTNQFDDCREAGAAMTLIFSFWSHQRALPPISFLSKSAWKVLVAPPASTVNDAKASIMLELVREGRPYIQQYLVATTTSRRAYLNPPSNRQSPKTMSRWTLSRYFLRFLIGLPRAGWVSVAKSPRVSGKSPV